eukprot:scaffold11321_cov22-Tisochrysis_lutea.AAC.3
MQRPECSCGKECPHTEVALASTVLMLFEQQEELKGRANAFQAAMLICSCKKATLSWQFQQHLNAHAASQGSTVNNTLNNAASTHSCACSQCEDLVNQVYTSMLARPIWAALFGEQHCEQHCGHSTSMYQCQPASHKRAVAAVGLTDVELADVFTGSNSTHMHS